MIPLTRPTIDDEEAQAVDAVLRSGQLVQGPQVAELEARVSAWCGREHGVAVSSGTSALHLGIRALGIGPGDEVLVPALTWPSPAHAVLACGARPVLVDVDPAEWNATGRDFAAARTDRTRAAIVIDQFGNPARRAEIERALGDLPLLEDAACALGSRFPDGPCGSLGKVSCLSFHPRKILTTGEGGMCLTDDDQLAERLRALRNHGQVAKGTFREPAGNHRMSEMAAALGVVQMGRLEQLLEARRTRAAIYHERLSGLAPQQAPEGAQASYQTFGVLLPPSATEQARSRVIRDLASREVQAGLLSYALHQVGSLGDAATVPERGLPHTEAIAERGIALPLFPTMSDEEQDTVIEAVTAVMDAIETS